MSRVVFLTDFASAGVVAYFSTRDGGVSEGPYATLNVGLHVGDDPAMVLENRKAVTRHLNVPTNRVTYARQIHGTEVAVVDTRLVGKGALSQDDAVPDVDAMVTTMRGVGLAVLAADCVPILFADAQQGVIGVAHAGWRGATKSIAQKTVQSMLALGARLENLQVALGPAIRGCCYEVDEPVILAAQEAYRRIGVRPPWKRSAMGVGRVMLDLPALCRDELLVTGVDPRHIIDVSACTCCMSGFYSHRRDEGLTGRHGGFIALSRR